MVVEFADAEAVEFDPRLRVIEEVDRRKVFEFDQRKLSVGAAIALIANQSKIVDIAVREPKLEEIVRTIYEERAT